MRTASPPRGLKRNLSTLWAHWPHRMGPGAVHVKAEKRMQAGIQSVAQNTPTRSLLRHGYPWRATPIPEAVQEHGGTSKRQGQPHLPTLHPMQGSPEQDLHLQTGGGKCQVGLGLPAGLPPC